LMTGGGGRRVCCCSVFDPGGSEAGRAAAGTGEGQARCVGAVPLHLDDSKEMTGVLNGGTAALELSRQGRFPRSIRPVCYLENP
jgi:hypothetical protein